MHSFKALEQAATNSTMYCQSPFYLRGDENGRHHTRFSDLGELDHFHQEDAVDLSRSSIYNMKMSNVGVVPNNLQFGSLTTKPRSITMRVQVGLFELPQFLRYGLLPQGMSSILRSDFPDRPSMGSSEIASVGSIGENTGQFIMQKGTGIGNGNMKRNGNTDTFVDENAGIFGNGNFENWADSGIAADNSHQTDTSTDVDTDDKIHSQGVQHQAAVVLNSIDQFRGGTGDHKVTRRLAQNREAARKSRLRKKAYIQQLENSKIKLSQMEQELQQTRQQGMFVASGISGDHCHSIGSTGALAFDMDYTRWLDEHQRLNGDLRSAVNSHKGDSELRLLVDSVMSHYDEIFKLKGISIKADVFHMLSGMWKTPAERCFMWLGGFRPSDLLKIFGNHLEPLTDQQLVLICNLQQSSQQAEDALSQGMEALQQSLLETLSSNCLGPTGSGNVTGYMGQMGNAMTRLSTLESFLIQADLLRHQTLQQLHRIFTTRQAARALLSISDYMTRLRALSSLWLARPKI